MKRQLLEIHWRLVTKVIFLWFKFSLLHTLSCLHLASRYNAGLPYIWRTMHVHVHLLCTAHVHIYTHVHMYKLCTYTLHVYSYTVYTLPVHVYIIPNTHVAISLTSWISPLHHHSETKPAPVMHDLISCFNPATPQIRRLPECKFY